MLDLVPCRQELNVAALAHGLHDVLGERSDRAFLIGTNVEHLVSGTGYVWRARNQVRDVANVSEGARLASVAEHGERVPLH